MATREAASGSSNLMPNERSSLTLSVVICTRDRPDDLARCAASLAQCPPGAFAGVDVVVVDDSAHPVVPSERLERSFGSVVCTTTRNRSPGLFNARLTGLAASRGDIILFIDDDVTLAPEYLEQLAHAYARHPRAAGIGGVDQTDVPRPFGLRILHRVFLYDSGRPGALSAS